jgi:hypothetical protein
MKKQSKTFCRNGIISTIELANGGMGLVKPNGLVLTYPELKRTVNKDTKKPEITYAQRHGRDKVYGSKVFQRVTQSLARDIMAENILTASKKYHVVGTVHDELLLLVPEEQAEQALVDVIEIMRTPPAWAPDLPLDAEGGIGDSYGDAK